MRYLPLLLLIFALFACKDRIETGPVEIHYGEDVCERCKMIISEKNFATQYVLNGGKAKKFDDVGCMLEYLRENPGDREDILGAYVRDYDSGGWIDARKAYYFQGGDIKSPMGFGIAAFSSEESMRAYPQFDRGKVLGSFNELIGGGIDFQKPSYDKPRK
jgi:copper chaperone NosL